MPPWPFSSSASSRSAAPPRASPSLDRNVQSSTPFASSPQDELFSPYFDFEQASSRIATTSPRRPHTRSLSNTLPSLLVGVKKKSSRDDLIKPKIGAYDGNVESTTSPKKRVQRGKQTEGEVEAGTCATCGTRVKWPKGISEFRCTTCLMVNDLKPSTRRANHDRKRVPLHHPSTIPLDQNSDSCDSDLSVQKTRSIIDRCIDVFFEARRNAQNVSSVPVTPALVSPQPQNHAVLKEDIGLQNARPFNRDQNGLPSPGLFALSDGAATMQSSGSTHRQGKTEPKAVIDISEAATSPTSASMLRRNIQSPGTTTTPHRSRTTTMPSRKPPLPPMAAIPSTSPPPELNASPMTLALNLPSCDDSPTRSPPDENSKDEPSNDYRAIFKLLEEHIIQEFGSHESLNSAFPTTKRARIDEGSSQRQPRSPPPPLPSPEPTTRRPTRYDTTLSEVDAKTLLLGDVAENGLWWTGRTNSKEDATASLNRERSTTRVTSMVQPRSPCIDYEELDRWYDMVFRTGEDWRERCVGLVSKEDEIALEHLFLKARTHIQRTVLKASEHLLKWPGRPLKTPSDTRFLLIILANPIMYSATLSPKTTVDAPISKTNATTHSAVRGYTSCSIWDQRHSFSILKRVLGLLSHQSGETHRYLTSWFARFPADRFGRLVELIQVFITYRLSRQDERKPIQAIGSSGLIPGLAGTSAETSAQLHAALGLADKAKGGVDDSSQYPSYSGDWQMKSAARIMALLFSANKTFQGERGRERSLARSNSHADKLTSGHLLETSEFYNTMVDFADLVADFDIWEAAQGRFTFCQYPFLLSIGAKIRIMEHDARRQMDIKAREAFFNSILRNTAIEHYLTLRVRRDCLVEDSLKAISEVVGTGQQEIKKELKVQFVNEEGLDAGGLRKEWFLLLVREIFDPQHGLFIYDNESRFCYFNPHSFETSDQYFLVGVLLGLAIYNSTILDVALPPFIFKKLLAAAPGSGSQKPPFNRAPIQYTLDDLAEYRPTLARGLRQLLEYDGDVESGLELNFAINIDRYGNLQTVPLCTDGANRSVTNSTREEYVDLYVRYLLDVSVVRQFEPFKRGFFTICGGNALSLFQPEEIELLVRGSDEALDVASLKAVAVYENWRLGDRLISRPAEDVKLIQWFWEFFEEAEPKDQRKLLGFITGSDRIPALGATSLVIKIGYAGRDATRFPVARTCFNQLLLYQYGSKEELVGKLWRAVCESEGFGLK